MSSQFFFLLNMDVLDCIGPGSLQAKGVLPNQQGEASSL